MNVAPTIALVLVFAAVVLVASSLLVPPLNVLRVRYGELFDILAAHGNEPAQRLSARLMVMAPVACLALPLTLHVVTGLVTAPLLLAALALVLPTHVAGHLKRRRRDSIDRLLPDALAQIATSLRAGSTLVSALQSYTEESDNCLADEFATLAKSVRLGTPLGVAFDELVHRVGSQELALSVAAIQVARESGGPLAEVLRRFAADRRRALEMEARVRALTSQGVLQGYVVTALPYLVLAALYVIEPVAMRPLHTSLLGWATLAAILVLQCTGLYFIRRIVAIRT